MVDCNVGKEGGKEDPGIGLASRENAMWNHLLYLISFILKDELVNNSHQFCSGTEKPTSCQ